MAIFLFIFLLLMMAYAILIEYYRKAWKQIPATEKPATAPGVFLSVIIPVRNEAENIPDLLYSLHQQTYPKHLYQVIIVDDHSTDHTWSLLQETTHEGLSLTCLQLAEYLTEGEIVQAHKKKAIETGIRLARGTLIVTTDADCRFDPDWLWTIAGYYEATGARFIAAPVIVHPERSVLSVFEALDFLTLQGITGASVFKRFHSMCNGANLAYTREAFYEVEGFSGIDSIPSGDDMLLMHKIHRKYPGKVFYLKSEQAIVTTRPQKSWKDFLQQRIRWSSKADRYEDKRIFRVLLLVYALNGCFAVLAVLSFWYPGGFFFLLLLLIAKIMIEFPFVNAVAIFFRQQSLMKYFPLLQPLHILYTIIAGGLGKFGSYEWKGRRIQK